MLIKIEKTPNPQTLKFIVDKKWLDFIWECKTEEESKHSPLASVLWKTGDVLYLFFGYDFVSITKKEDQEWDVLKPIFLGAISDFLQENIQLINKRFDENNNLEGFSDFEKKIIEVLDQKVQPAVEGHGGAIKLVKFENGILFLDLQGACKGCPSSIATLKNGVENLMKYYFPEIESVEAV